MTAREVVSESSGIRRTEAGRQASARSREAGGQVLGVRAT